jgi:hypothetical protein
MKNPNHFLKRHHHRCTLTCMLDNTVATLHHTLLLPALGTLGQPLHRLQSIKIRNSTAFVNLLVLCTIQYIEFKSLF